MIPERKAEVYFLIENIERQKTESIHCHHSARWSIPLTANTKIKPNIKPISISFFITDIIDATLSLSWDLQDDDEERRARNQQRRQAKNLETGMSVTESPGMDRQVYLWL